MIRKFIKRILTLNAPKKGVPTEKRKAAIIGQDRHGLSREQISPGSRQVCEALQQRGYKAYVVGGAVRDLLSGLTPKDFDVATDATPEEIRRCVRRSRVIGRRFRIVHVMMGRETVEVTTFRGIQGEDIETDAHGRVLKDNVFGTLSEDATRRDFTVNALYFDPATEQILDYYHGVADLQQKTLRIIGDPKARYREDPVRILRAIRLSVRLGLSIDPLARRPIRDMAQLLENVPEARLFDEMMKILTSGQAAACLKKLRAEGLYHGILPLLDMVLEQDSPFAMLSLANTDERIRQGKSCSPSFLFATLLWQQLLTAWNRIQEEGESPVPALHLAMREILDRQDKKLVITRRIAADIKEIWALQPRFEQRSGKRPYGLLEHPRFRAAYDFLCLRVDSGEQSAELKDWWDAFQTADGPERANMLIPAPNPKGRRRRKKKTPTATDGHPSSGTPSC